jgi:hypothetical protein
LTYIFVSISGTHVKLKNINTSRVTHEIANERTAINLAKTNKIVVSVLGKKLSANRVWEISITDKFLISSTSPKLVGQFVEMRRMAQFMIAAHIQRPGIGF